MIMSLLLRAALDEFERVLLFIIVEVFAVNFPLILLASTDVGLDRVILLEISGVGEEEDEVEEEDGYCPQPFPRSRPCRPCLPVMLFLKRESEAL
jgi:hypothetical protein